MLLYITLIFQVYLTELSNEKTRRETFTKDMARYYEEVKVCDVCYKYYLLLDWARNVLDTAAQLRGKDNLMQLSRRQINSSERLLSANSLTKTDSHSVPLLDEKHQASSDLNHIQVATKKKSKNTWKSYTNTTTQEGSSSFSRDQFADLDDYLRKGTAAVAKRRLNEKNSKIQHILGSNKHVGSSIDESTVYRGRIMLACGEGDDASLMKKILEDNFFDVKWIPEGRQASNEVLSEEYVYDCILVQKDLPLADAFMITAAVREGEKMNRKRAAATAAAQGRGIQPPTKRTAVICVTHDTSPSDLKLYMECGMDGCISYPISKVTLLNTVRAAVPHHLAQLEAKEAAETKNPLA